MIPHLNRLVKTGQMRGHNICFYAELTKVIPNDHQVLSYLKLFIPFLFSFKMGYEIFFSLSGGVNNLVL